MAYDGFYEIRVFRGAGAGDPVIDAAQTLQQALASTLGQVGSWGLALLVTLLAGTPVAVAAVRARRRARASDRPATTTSLSVREVSSE